MEGSTTLSKKAKTVAGQILIVIAGTLSAIWLYEQIRARKVKAPATAATSTAAPASAPTT